MILNILKGKAMNAREERGLTIAALCKLNKTPDCWLVPSQTETDRVYRVDPVKQTCTCPDPCGSRSQVQASLSAVEFTAKREYHEDGTVTDTQSITFTKKTTYKQGTGRPTIMPRPRRKTASWFC